MKNKLQIFILTLIVISLSSCYNYQDLKLLQDSKRLPVYEKSEYTDYRIQINDELIYRLITSDEKMSNLISTQNNSSSGQNQISYRVYKDGTIDLPFVDSIHVVGLTINEATVAIETRIRQIIPDAIIKLSMANKTFSVFGDIGTGTFPIYKEKLTIFQALAMVSDFNEESDRRHIRIIRETDQGTKILEFDIRPKSIIDSKYYYVYPNDIIYVRRGFGSFYKVDNYFSLLGIVSSSLSLFFYIMISNSKAK